MEPRGRRHRREGCGQARREQIESLTIVDSRGPVGGARVAQRRGYRPVVAVSDRRRLRQ